MHGTRKRPKITQNKLERSGNVYDEGLKQAYLGMLQVRQAAEWLHGGACGTQEGPRCGTSENEGKTEGIKSRNRARRPFWPVEMAGVACQAF